MMFNSTDLKNSNNSLYERREGDFVEQWYVTRDVGSALGDTTASRRARTIADSFEQMPFILGVSNGYVDFAYNGWYKNLVRDRIKPEDVAWACNLLGRLSEKQMQRRVSRRRLRARRGRRVSSPGCARRSSRAVR